MGHPPVDILAQNSRRIKLFSLAHIGPAARESRATPPSAFGLLVDLRCGCPILAASRGCVLNTVWDGAFAERIIGCNLLLYWLVSVMARFNTRQPVIPFVLQGTPLPPAAPRSLQLFLAVRVRLNTTSWL